MILNPSFKYVMLSLVHTFSIYTYSRLCPSEETFSPGRRKPPNTIHIQSKSKKSSSQTYSFYVRLSGRSLTQGSKVYSSHCCMEEGLCTFFLKHTFGALYLKATLHALVLFLLLSALGFFIYAYGNENLMYVHNG